MSRGGGDKFTTILMVDDDHEDDLLVKDAMMEAGIHQNLRYLPDSEGLMDYLVHRGEYSDPKIFPMPSLVLLKLHMPRKDGYETLKDIKANPTACHIPVVIFTASSDVHEMAECYRLGASSFIIKPQSFESLVKAINTLRTHWLDTDTVCPPVPIKPTERESWGRDD